MGKSFLRHKFLPVIHDCYMKAQHPADLCYRKRNMAATQYDQPGILLVGFHKYLPGLRFSQHRFPQLLPTETFRNSSASLFLSAPPDKKSCFLPKDISARHPFPFRRIPVFTRPLFSTTSYIV